MGHHGSRYSTTPSFLSAVNPRIAVISVGASNSYGHPGPETLSRLDKAGVKVYRTDQNGTVVVSTQGKDLTVSTAKTPQVMAQPPPPASESGPALAPAPPPSGTPPLLVPPPPPAPSGDPIVYVTRTGAKYHRDGCRYLSKSKIPIRLSEAKARGYGPCSVCNPPL